MRKIGLVLLALGLTIAAASVASGQEDDEVDVTEFVELRMLNVNEIDIRSLEVVDWDDEVITDLPERTKFYGDIPYFRWKSDQVIGIYAPMFFVDWNVTTGEIARLELVGIGEYATVPPIAPDESYIPFAIGTEIHLVVGPYHESEDYLAGIDLNPESYEDAQILIGHEENSEEYLQINDLSWSSDSRYLASAGSDRTVRVWEAATGENVQVFEDHKAPVTHVLWSPTQEVIVSGDRDGVLYAWSVESGESLVELVGHTDQISDLQWAEDPLRLISAADDGTVRVWGVPE